MHPCLVFLFAFNTITAVNAGLFVVKPLQGFTCHAGKPCRVDWLDDGIHPLLTAIGVVDVGLHHEKQQLVQTIQSVNVATAHSLSFTPIPGAGPNSDNYYISLVSTSLLSNTSQPFASYSSFFRLDGMTGSFDRPQPAATSPFPVPPSVATGDRPVKTGDVLFTISVSAISSTPKPPSLSQPTDPSPVSEVPTIDVPIINALTTMPSGSSTSISPPPLPSPAAEPLSSPSTPLPSDAVADTTTANGVFVSSSPIASVPVADTPPPNGAVISSSPVPSPTVADTTSPNGHGVSSSVPSPTIADTTSPNGPVVSSSPVPSPTLADTTSSNDAAVCNISSAINIFIAVSTLYLVMAF